MLGVSALQILFYITLLQWQLTSVDHILPSLHTNMHRSEKVSDITSYTHAQIWKSVRHHFIHTCTDLKKCQTSLHTHMHRSEKVSDITSYRHAQIWKSVRLLNGGSHSKIKPCDRCQRFGGVLQQGSFSFHFTVGSGHITHNLSPEGSQRNRHWS